MARKASEGRAQREGRSKQEEPMLPGMEDDSEQARPRSRAASASRNPRFSTGRIITIAFTFFIALVALLFVSHSIEQFLIRDSRFALAGADIDTPAVEIAGIAHASRKQIERVFAIDAGRSVYLLPLSERRNALRQVDWVRDASIARLWPNRVVVDIRERKPVAFVTLTSSRFGLIDEDGVILPPAPDRFNLPVLAGVRGSDPIEDRRDRVRRMLRLTRELDGFAGNISEIDASDRDNLKATEKREGHVVTLLLGDRNFAARYHNFLMNYPEIKKRLPNASTLDLRLEDRITVVE